MVDADGIEIAPMSSHEQQLFDMWIADKQCKADHPITCLNPEEWFTPVTVKIDEGRVWVRGLSTCWWSINSLEFRDAQLHSNVAQRPLSPAREQGKVVLRSR